MAGLLLVGAAGMTAWQTSRFIAPAASAPGTVTRLKAGGSNPQITFGTPHGTLVSYRKAA